MEGAEQSTLQAWRQALHKIRSAVTVVVKDAQNCT